MKHSRHKRLSRKKFRRRLTIAAVIIIALAVFIPVRMHYISAVPLQGEVDDTRVLLDALAEQDVDAAQAEIDSMKETVSFNESLELYDDEDDGDTDGDSESEASGDTDITDGEDMP